VIAERITRADVDTRCENLNRRLTNGRQVQAQGRNGYIGLNEYDGGSVVRTITVGTTREVGDFLHAMMVGIDLSRTN
jgi:hypothetical protein